MHVVRSGFESQAGQRILVKFVLVLHLQFTLSIDFVLRTLKNSVKFHMINYW